VFQSTEEACSLSIHTFHQFAHGVEYGPDRAVIGEPVATAALVPDLLHPLPAPQDPVAPADKQQQQRQQQRQNKTISIT
jgi:hypothetical protein